MEKKSEGKNPVDVKLALEKHYIQMQGLGLALWLAIPIATLLLYFFKIAIYVTLPVTILVLGSVGFACLEIYEDKRNELRSTNDKQGGDNGNSN